MAAPDAAIPVTLPYGTGEVDAVIFDLDDVLIPFQTPAAWQWAWRPQGPLLGERRVRAAVRRSLRAWDRRRWAGLTGKEPPADAEALRQHLASTLAAIAGHALPATETDAVVRRMLRPAGEVEHFPDVAPALGRLASRQVRIGIVTELPRESALWMLHRGEIAESLLLISADPGGSILPERAAFRSAVDRLGSTPERTAFVGDLYWSDVRAAARAGLAAVLLDRHDAWSKIQHGRLATLDALEATLARGPAPPGGADAEGESEPAPFP
ncbi:MAG TPA: HAD family hydrolase [Thermoplasmata archaeon]|nr:HAD family hydrolase [Thermoplasmata archaeon]